MPACLEEPPSTRIPMSSIEDDNNQPRGPVVNGQCGPLTTSMLEFGEWNV